MHLTAAEATTPQTVGGATVQHYPTGGGTQDVSSLERFALHSLPCGGSTGQQRDAERESILLVRSGSGSVTRGDGAASITVEVHPKDLLLFPPDQPHSLQASSTEGLEFIDVAFHAEMQRVGEPLLARPEGIGSDLHFKMMDPAFKR